MLRTTHAAAMVFLSAAAVGLAADPDPKSTFPPPRLVPDATPPAPAPGNQPVLTADLRYVFDTPADCDVRGYPDGLIAFEKKKGPRDVTAKFFGGLGEEDRSFAGPHVWVGRAVGKGVVTVVVTPYGLKTSAEILRDTFAVDSGKSPQPPPKPDPDPDPDPKPDPKPVAVLRVVLVYETAPEKNYTPSQNGVLYGRVVEEYLDKACGKAGWTRRDRDTDPANDRTAFKDLWAAVKPQITSTPCLVIAADKDVTLEPIPATMRPEDAVALLKKYAGGK